MAVSSVDDATGSLPSSSSGPAILTALAGCILLPYVLAPPLLRAVGLPPLTALTRRFRPWAHALVVAGWIVLRISRREAAFDPAFELLADGDGGGRGGGERGGSERNEAAGLLDLFVLLVRRASALALASASELGPSSRAISATAVLLNDILGLLLLRASLSAVASLLRLSLSEIKSVLVHRAFVFASENIGAVRKELAKEEDKMLNQIEHETKDPTRTITRTLPAKGMDGMTLVEEIRKRARKEDEKWRDGLVSGTVYSGEKGHTNLLNEVYAAYSWSNPLHTDVWPSVNQFEAEVVSMTASLLNGGDTSVVGAMTSGGTESIVLAVRSALRYFGHRRSISHPEIVCSTTAHAGLDKACDMMCIRMVRLRPDPITFALRPEDVERAVGRNTVMVYSSAPNFPQGVIDPIGELAVIARRHGVGLHVDACLGGFVLPFARKLGYDVPDFDFGCRGVTSMSVDTHKYGYATKGTSVVLYRHKALRQAQYFAYPHWTGGLYATPTIAGSRAGGLLACAWASMISLGEEGYLSRVKSIMDATQTIALAVAGIPGLKLMGGLPKAMIVCFGSDEFDIYRVGDKMSKLGWSLNALQRPACIHLCVTLQTVTHADKFVNELEKVVAEVRGEGSDGKKSGNAAIYGLAGSLPPGPVESLLKCYTDAMLTP